MSFKQYVYIMIFGTLVCFLALFMVLNFFNPETGGIGGFLLLYISLGLSLIGTFSLIGLLMRHYFGNDQLVFRDVINSFRQGILLSILIVAVLILKSLDLMMWWNVLILIFALTFLEVFLISYKSRNNI